MDVRQNSALRDDNVSEEPGNKATKKIGSVPVIAPSPYYRLILYGTAAKEGELTC